MNRRTRMNRTKRINRRADGLAAALFLTMATTALAWPQWLSI